MDIFVTVGMSRWPFDRLLEAVRPLCNAHNLMVQTGPSQVKLPCNTCAFLPYSEVLDRIAHADIVITHAGNSVRIVQRQGKVPIAMAREAARGEMPNDHQVRYLLHEQVHGRVVPLWNPADLPSLIETHMETQSRLLATRPLPPSASAEDLAGTLNRLCEKWVR